MATLASILRPGRRRRGRRLALLAGVTAGIAAYRNRALAANERRYAERLGLGTAHPAEGAGHPTKELRG